MTNKEKINWLKPVPFEKYSDITSYEKLMLYTAIVLEENNVPLTFNYMCVAAFKLFPDKFCCDNEFTEFPSVDRLNRTMMHLKYVKKWTPSIVWTIETWYKLTNLWRATAENVKARIRSDKISTITEKPIVDAHKKWIWSYSKFIEWEWYKKYLETDEIDPMYIWKFFGITPYTQIKKVKQDLNDIRDYAKENKNDKCELFITNILKSL